MYTPVWWSMLPAPVVIDHDTAGFDEPATLAKKVFEPPGNNVAAVGETVTVTDAAVTGTLTLFPVCDPGPGWRTETCRLLGDAAVPEAISLVAETNVVTIGWPFTNTWESGA